MEDGKQFKQIRKAKPQRKMENRKTLKKIMRKSNSNLQEKANAPDCVKNTNIKKMSTLKFNIIYNEH